MRGIISFAFFAAIMIPMAIWMVIVFKNELEIRDKVTGGYGLVPVTCLVVILVIMPTVAFFLRF